MGGSSSVRGDQTIYHTDNMCFDGTDRGSPMALDGQLWIGSTTSNRPDNGGHVRLGQLTSPDNSVAIGYSAPNITLQAGAAMGTLKTLTPDLDFDGSAATPISGTAGNINTFGVNPSFATVTDSLNSNGLATGNLQIEHRAWLTGLVVDASTTPGTRGTFSTIAAALTAAVSGQTIFIRTGTYTENLTLKAGVNLAAFECDSSLNGTGNVIISGNATFSAAGTVTISGIQLQTNSAPFLTVSGANASVVNLNNCYLNCTNNTGISFTSSDASAVIRINNCSGNLGTTGIAIIVSTSTGGVAINNCIFTNSGGSTTANSTSAGLFFLNNSTFSNPITTTSTGSLGAENISVQTFAQNVTGITANGSGANNIFSSIISTGTASAISVGSTVAISLSNLISSNANTITGAGTAQFSGITQGITPGSINPTTPQGGTLLGITNGTAVGAGYLGEQIRSAVGSGSAVALTTNIPANITSISLTAGIWDVSGSLQFAMSSTAAGSIGISINTTSATLGTLGDNYFLSINTPTAAALFNSVALPSYRIMVSSTTTVYLVGIAIFPAGTNSAFGRISATRVG